MKIGQVIDGRFEIEQHIGSGGMGSVYRARDLVNGSAVALKLLHGQGFTDSERFDREAAILAELGHPAIVRYVAHGTTEQGLQFIAMEWLDGRDLGAVLSRQKLTLEQGVAVVRRAAEALDYAHGRGIVHRDIKPENLFLPGGLIERLKVLDFGIARLLDSPHRLTQTGVIIGTPGYMAPEVVKGLREIDARADFFSLGCVFFKCLTGRNVISADEPAALLTKTVLDDIPRAREFAPDVPPAIDDIVAHMLAKDPDARLADAKTLLDRLASFEGNGDVPLSAPRNPPAPALTATEQRVICVVITGSADLVRCSYPPPAAAPTAALAGRSRPPSASRILQATARSPELPDVQGARVHLLPDGLTVLTFADPKAPDQAVRAARAALALTRISSRLCAVVAGGRGYQSATRVGGEVIESGIALLRAHRGAGARLNGMAAGLLDGRFEIERDGDSYLLRRERESFDARANLLGKRTDFVGRARELSTLTQMLGGCISDAMATAAIVTGTAGVGKSRLLQEFLTKVRAENPSVEIWFGQGDSVGSGSAFGMLAKAIRRAAAIQDGEPAILLQKKLAQRVGLHLNPADVDRVVPFVGEMGNFGFADDHLPALRAARQNRQLMGDAMRRAWEDWLAAECTANPLLLVLEDLHWGDLGTVAFVDAALRHLRDRPFMVLSLARPDVHTRFPNLWAERDVQSIRLGPLPRRAAERLVRDALGGDAEDEVVGRIVMRADGNAFYLEELVRAVTEGRADSLPDSILGMVQTRLDAEGDEAKRTLRAASIFGERFCGSGVAALLGEDGAQDLSDCLDRLAARELIVRTAGVVGTNEEPEYVFAHALVRDAAYATLTEEDRVLGHKLAGFWLEETGSLEAMALAEHFQKGQEPGKAAPWYLRAAELALGANDLGSAIERADLGVRMGASGATLGGLRLVQAEAHVWRGELAVAQEKATEATADLGRGTAPWLRAASQVIIAVAKQGNWDEVESWVERANELAAPEAGSALVSCLSWGANYLLFGGRYAMADSLLRRIAALAGDFSNVERQTAALVHQVRSVRASIRGDLGGCLEEQTFALSGFESAGDVRNAIAVRVNMGCLFTELGEYERAEASLRAALSDADRMGLRDLAAAAVHNLGLVVASRGSLDEARELESRAVDAFQKQGDRRLLGVARSYLAQIAIWANDAPSAEREARAALELLTVSPALRIGALAMLSRALLLRGEPHEALEHAGKAMLGLEELGEIEERESEVWLAYAECLLACGNEQEGRAAVLRARDRLLDRASKIADDRWRGRFLEGVPTNARTLALAYPGAAEESLPASTPCASTR